MTIPSFMGLQTALRGLLADQAAIDTTGHNIDNANTVGYSRQRAVLTESDAMSIPALSNVTGAGAQLGTGVDVSTIARVRDQFLDIQYRAQNSATSAAGVSAQILDQVQTALAEPTDHGLASQLNAFWSAWSDLANAPQSPAAQQAVLEAGQTVSQTFNTLDQQLGTIESQVDQQFQSLTGANGRVQSDVNQIASLNLEISQSLGAGQTPNDLMDQRDQLIDDLSSLASISVTDPGNGMLQISFKGSATPVVNGATVNWPQTLTAASGGQLGALKALYDSSTGTGQLVTYRSDLDAVANQLITTVNGQYANAPGAPTFFSGNSAGTIAVAATTVAAGSATDPTGNEVALAMAALQGKAADQAYAQFVGQVGSDVQSTKSNQQTAQSLLSAIGNQRQSVSGVSLDEEMTNLVTFQRGYQASARMMTTIDDMLDTLINRTGRVGL